MGHEQRYSWRLPPVTELARDAYVKQRCESKDATSALVAICWVYRKLADVNERRFNERRSDIDDTFLSLVHFRKRAAMAQITRDRDDAENRDKFERRSGRRVTLSFPIEVSGFD